MQRLHLMVAIAVASLPTVRIAHALARVKRAEPRKSGSRTRFGPF